MKAEGEKRGVEEERRKTGKWQGCRGGRDAEPAVMMLQLCHQPAPELPRVMEALLLENEGIRLGCPLLDPCARWGCSSPLQCCGLCPRKGMQERLGAPLSCLGEDRRMIRWLWLCSRAQSKGRKLQHRCLLQHQGWRWERETLCKTGSPTRNKQEALISSPSWL